MLMMKNARFRRAARAKIALPPHLLRLTMLALATSNASALPPSVLSGAVTDSAGLPMRGIRVHLEALTTHDGFNALTDGNGAFRFTMPEGEYQLTITAQHFRSVTQRVSLHAGDNAAGVIRLKVAGRQESVVVKGTIGLDGALPLPSATAGLLGERDRLDQPFLVTAYASANAEQHGSETIGDSLQSDAGIMLATGSQKNSPFFEMIYSRGLAINNYTGVAVDGLYGLGGTLPITDPVGITEHLSGPATFLAGVPGNVGGTLNLRPKRANGPWMIRVDPEYTSNTIGGLHGDGSVRFGKGAAFGARATSMYRAGQTSIRNNKLWQNGSSVDLDYTTRKLVASFDLQHDRTLNRGYSLYQSFGSAIAVPAPPSGNASTQLPWMEAWDRDLRVLGRARYIPNGRWQIYFGAGHTDSRFEYGGYCQATITSLSGAANCSPIQAANLASILSVDTGTQISFRTAGLKHQLRAAYDRISYPSQTYGTLILSSLPISFNVYAADRPATSLLRTARPATYLTAYQRTNSFAIADTVSIFHDRIAVTLGGRYTAPTARSYSSTGALTATTAASQWTPAVAAIYHLSPSVSFYGNVVQALEPAGSAPLTAANANAILPPLESLQQEFGAKFQLGSWNAEAGAFRIRRSSQYLEPSTNLYVQNGIQLNRGLDGRLWFQPSRTSTVQLAASFINATLERTAGGTFDGKRAPSIPRATVRASMYTAVPWIGGRLRDALQAGLALDAVSATPYDNSNQRTLPAWAKITPLLRFHSNAEESLSVQFLVENATGGNYWISAGNGLVSIGGARSYQVRFTRSWR